MDTQLKNQLYFFGFFLVLAIFVAIREKFREKRKIKNSKKEPK